MESSLAGAWPIMVMGVPALAVGEGYPYWPGVVLMRQMTFGAPGAGLRPRPVGRVDHEEP